MREQGIKVKRRAGMRIEVDGAKVYMGRWSLGIKVVGRDGMRIKLDGD